MMKYINKLSILFPVILISFSLFNCNEGSGNLNIDSNNGNGNNNGEENNNGNNNSNGNNNDNTFNTLVEYLTSLQTTAESGGSYTYEVKTDENIIPQNLTYSGKNNITITLKGNNTNRIVSLSTTGAMFTVRSGVTLILEDNLVLQGLASNTQPLVTVAADAIFIINDGIKITGNNNTSSTGGGVVLSSALSALGQNEGGKFIMNGGEISNNKAIGGEVE